MTEIQSKKCSPWSIYKSRSPLTQSGYIEIGPPLHFYITYVGTIYYTCIVLIAKRMILHFIMRMVKYELWLQPSGISRTFKPYWNFLLFLFFLNEFRCIPPVRHVGNTRTKIPSKQELYEPDIVDSCFVPKCIHHVWFY